MKAREIIQLMEDWAPPKLVEPWDNTGFQIGDQDKEIKKILVSLDLSQEVYEKAIKDGVDMIINHHPLIFKPVSSITTQNYNERLLYNLIRNDIVVYNAHTNLDQADGGVNDELAKILGLKNTKPLKLNSPSYEAAYGFGKVGDIDKTHLKDYINIIKDKLDLDWLTLYGDDNIFVERVALCGGSGADFIIDAVKENASIYISGDIKYHDAQLGTNLGLTIIDAGHYHTEKIILPVIKDYLLGQSKGELDIEVWDKSNPNYKIY